MLNSPVNILAVTFDPADFSFKFSGLTLLLLTIAMTIFAWMNFRKIKRLFTIKEQKVELNFAGQKVTYVIQKSTQNIEIAYKIYIELITRKAALPFDDNHDTITEVYDSWYKLFGIIREEMKKLDGDSLLKINETYPLISLSTDILNRGLRPHLTKYQSKFRKWLLENPKAGLSPQEIQKTYPDYQILVADIRDVNTLLIDYSNQLKSLINGEGL